MKNKGDYPSFKGDNKMKRNILKLVASLIICQLAGIIGSFFTTPAIPIWYVSLEKPSFTPPDAVFSPVWITLFVLMGISLYFIWRELPRQQGAKIALYFFILQLVLNVCWSIIFFGLQNPFAAFIEIIILWIAILLTILVSFRVSKTAAILLIPYILWVSFAAVLNFFIWNLNS
jgi:benzodiazapine receptor